MTQTAPIISAPRTRRPNSEYRWTGAKVIAFLDALAERGDVSAAARRVGISRQSAYRLRDRLARSRLKDAWDNAQRAGIMRKVTQMPPPKVTWGRTR